MKIVLVGYMGSGKSSVGKLLAEALEIPFTDLDTYIEQRQGKTITQIFEEKGEPFFRQLEAESLKEVLRSNGALVLAAGGGTPCYGHNIQEIVKNAEHSIYLQATVPALVARLKKEKDHRPLIRDMSRKDLTEFIEGHLSKRRVFYTQAKHTVASDQKTVAAVVAEIKNVIYTI